MNKASARQPIRRLLEIRNRFDAGSAAEKVALLEKIAAREVRSASDARKLHQALMYIRAFPDSAAVCRRAGALLDRFEAVVSRLPSRHKSRLADSGIAGTDLFYPFSFDVARWMVRAHPGVAAIDWRHFGGAERLDELLAHLLEDAESEYFYSGRVDTEAWLALASGGTVDGGFHWLLSQLAQRGELERFWTAMYDAAEVPIRCSLADSGLSKGNNRLPGRKIFYRSNAMRARVSAAKREILRPIRRIAHLDAEAGARAIDTAMSSLAVRHRETNHFNHANPDEVYVADVGEGIRIIVTGLKHEHRYPLETTMGFLIVSNDVPVGYGGSSALFRQANTGINIFAEFRGSEAAWFWVQVMRTIRQLTTCNRFVANPYQFGAGNTEALNSGAFWFYYRLGYRPVLKDVRDLARAEFRQVQGRRHSRRTPLETLKVLASCDMHLELPGARDGEFFEEELLEFASLLATRALAATGSTERRKSRDILARRLLAGLGVSSQSGWTLAEREWFLRLAPIVGELDPGRWPAADKRRLLALMRAKGGRLERDFARRCGRAARLFRALRTACRQIASEH